ncbi:ras-like protein rasb [Anaeramoeba flamelloides]|uniref:Ras-like protein rasb n=1 Tax=Anaeramoeba flamelloides TaxID=1746091 RepID=A0AAV7Z768_9EUKA|nr:ras-like protein rasb [Anaeramoeba flamelloides]KAJ6245052.1 ras-like protein rasb [Anaeramoeba flamelloides]
MSQSDFKIVVVGGGGVGKSAITIQFLQNYFVTDYDPTIEESYRKQVIVDSETCLLDILDTAGQEDYSAMREQYMQSGEGFILVYSIVARDTFVEIPELKDMILRVKDESYFPMVVVGNKCDLEDQRSISKDEGLKFAESIGCPFFETSAKKVLNITESFYEIVRSIRKYLSGKVKKDVKKKKGKKHVCSII